MDVADGRVVRTEMDRRPHLETESAVAGNEAIGDVHRVLHVRQEHVLFQDIAGKLIAPDGQAGFQAKLRQVLSSRQSQLAVRVLLTAQVDECPVRQSQLFPEVVEHHAAAQRVGQRGDQQAVIAARRNSCHRPRGVAAQAVGHEPLARQQGLVLGGVALTPRHFENEIVHRVQAAGQRVLTPCATSRGGGPPLLRRGFASFPPTPAAPYRRRRSADPRSTRGDPRYGPPAEPATAPGPDPGASHGRG